MNRSQPFVPAHLRPLLPPSLGEILEAIAIAAVLGLLGAAVWVAC